MRSLRERIEAMLGRRLAGPAPDVTQEDRAGMIAALQDDAATAPSEAAAAKGRRALLSNLNDGSTGGVEKMGFAQFVFSPVAAALVGGVLIFGGMAGASAAAGGPDVSDPVMNAVGLGDDGPDEGVGEGGTDDQSNDQGEDEQSGHDGPDDDGSVPGSEDEDPDDDSSVPGTAGGDDDDDAEDSPQATPDDDDPDETPEASPEAPDDDHGD